MIEIDNGFYIWVPIDDDGGHMLSLNQVVQVIECEVWLTGVCDRFTVEAALEFGGFGKCVLKEDE